MLRGAKYRAKRDGLPFNLVLNDISIPTICPATGIAISANLGGGRMTDASPTLDRIDPGRGYTRENVVVVSWRANRIKSNIPISELKRVADFYAKIRNKP